MTRGTSPEAESWRVDLDLPDGWLLVPKKRRLRVLERDPYALAAQQLVKANAVDPKRVDAARHFLERAAPHDRVTLASAAFMELPAVGPGRFALFGVVGPASEPGIAPDIDWLTARVLAKYPTKLRAEDVIPTVLPLGPGVRAQWREPGAGGGGQALVTYWTRHGESDRMLVIDAVADAQDPGELPGLVAQLDAIAVSVTLHHL